MYTAKMYKANTGRFFSLTYAANDIHNAIWQANQWASHVAERFGDQITVLSIYPAEEAKEDPDAERLV